MALKILAQNALDAFSDPQTTDEYILLLERLSPDVAIFPEAYDIGRAEGVEAAVKRLEALGYDVTHGPYDDTDGRKDLHGTILLVRKRMADPTRSGRLTRIGMRNIAENWLLDPATGRAVHFVGVHLNDRSEAKRQAELDDLLKLLVDDEPTIIAGDFNGIHAQDAGIVKIRIARITAQLVKWRLMPAPEPTVATKPKKSLGRVGSLSKRLSEIASGKTMARLLAAGLTDADVQRRPTYPARAPFVQLDHVMLSPGLQVQQIEVLPKNSSDHLGIVAELTVK